MFYTYVLRSKKHGKLYIGFTTDLRERVKTHNAGSNTSTKAGVPWKLVYYEAFASEQDAREREVALKDFGRSYGQLKRRIKRSIDDV